MPNATRFRVLCVDDDEDACEMLSFLLKSHGIHATCARSAADAWLKIKTERFDLYMLDGWLPQVDGFEFCRQIRKFDSRTPILFYSGAAYDADKQKGIAAGANAYVIKPDIEGLIETMSDLIAKAKADYVVAPSVTTLRLPAEKALSALVFGVAGVGI
jgi:two-component system OmpR family response regulator